jgi:NADH-quinone oxidoreductase subunit N
MGFMLLGLTAGGGWAGGSFTAVNAYSSALYYTVAYVLMTLGAFGMILLSRTGFEAENLKISGLNKRSPRFAAVMLTTRFPWSASRLHRLSPSFPFCWRQSKRYTCGRGGGHVLLVGAFYYLRVVKLMF